jgi:Domain of unknown function (DUF4124)
MVNAASPATSVTRDGAMTQQFDSLPQVRIDPRDRRRNLRQGRRRTSGATVAAWLLVIALSAFAYIDSKQQFAMTARIVGQARALLTSVTTQEQPAATPTEAVSPGAEATQDAADSAGASSPAESSAQTDSTHVFRCVDSAGNATYSEQPCGGTIEIRRFAETEIRTQALPQAKK